MKRRLRTCGAKKSRGGRMQLEPRRFGQTVGLDFPMDEQAGKIFDDSNRAYHGRPRRDRSRRLSERVESARQGRQRCGRSHTQLCIECSGSIERRNVGVTADWFVVDEHLRNRALLGRFFEPVPQIWPSLDIDLVKSHAFAHQQRLGAMTVGAPGRRVDGDDCRHQ